MHFTYPQKVLFKHCDPAGIVFFPRYAEMVNDAVEALFSDALDWPFEKMHPEAGVPTVSIAMTFSAPSFHGDMLALEITLKAMGGSSLTLATRATCGEETRFVAEQTLVCVGPGGRPRRWPEPIRQTVDALMEAAP
jgi:4-hydroxybenzoyl-CoA thioesterase